MGLFEDERRRPDWIEGIPIRLENDQEWHFPRPVILLRLPVGGGEPTRVAATTETNCRFGDAYWRLQDETQAKIEEKADQLTILDFARIILPIATNLLCRNYDLTPDEVADLLLLIPNNARNAAMWEAINGACYGVGPKPEAAT